jgi:hypothetical protein
MINIFFCNLPLYLRFTIAIGYIRLLLSIFILILAFGVEKQNPKMKNKYRQL